MWTTLALSGFWSDSPEQPRLPVLAAAPRLALLSGLTRLLLQPNCSSGPDNAVPCSGLAAAHPLLQLNLQICPVAYDCFTCHAEPADAAVHHSTALLTSLTELLSGEAAKEMSSARAVRIRQLADGELPPLLSWLEIYLTKAKLRSETTAQDNFGIA